MRKQLLCAVLALCLLLPALAEAPLSLDALMTEIDKEIKSLTVGPLSFAISQDRQSIYIDRPQVAGADQYTIAYNIYDSDSSPVNYFYSLEERVAATPGYGGLFNVFVVVTDAATGEQNTSNIGWQELSWPLADRLTVGKASFEVSPDKKSIFVDRPSIACRSGRVTIAYNIYDHNSQPVNYFYSTQKRVAATPGYDGKFNVFIVVTDTETGEQDVQNIGWTILGEGPRPTAEPTAVPTATPEPTATPTATPAPTPIVRENEDLKYKILDGKVTILSYKQYYQEYHLPGEIDGYPVVAIGSYAFAGNEELRVLTIPDSVETIGEAAFKSCIWLQNFTLPSRLTSISNGLFTGCESLTEMTVPAGVTSIGYRSFKYCVGLKTIHLPEGLDGIGAEAFMDCRRMKQVDIPDSVTSIGYTAFYGCRELEAMRFGPGSRLNDIGNGILANCEAVTVTAPSGSPMRTYCEQNGIPFVAVD